MSDVPPLLTRKQASEFLGRHGFPVAVATLDTKASRGGGPSFRHWGTRVLYEQEALLTWAHARLRPVVQNTSETERQPRDKFQFPRGA